MFENIFTFSKFEFRAKLIVQIREQYDTNSSKFFTHLNLVRNRNSCKDFLYNIKDYKFLNKNSIQFQILHPFVYR